MPQKPTGDRLERYLAHEGLCSRREAKELIRQGAVLVNGKPARDPGQLINPEYDTITVPGSKMPDKETVLLYKPRGIETSATSAGAADIKKKFPKLAHLHPIGRLDKESEGLILLSNDGTLARALTGERGHVEKEYLVTTREPVTDTHLQSMSRGMIIDKVKTKPAHAERRSRTSFSLTLHEGRKHQIRRMCVALFQEVADLKRVRVMNIELGKQSLNSLREIKGEELKTFLDQVLKQA